MSAYLETAEAAALEAGELLRDNFGRSHEVQEYHAHDIKLALDVRAQELIANILLKTYPDHALFGEEGIAGDRESEFQWIVDPIDGTVNYFFGIPHFAVSIALRHAGKIITGAVYDPMMDELWTAETDRETLMNGKPANVSPRKTLAEAVVSIGLSKTKETLERGLEQYRELAFKVRKTRMFGSAALGLTYVASGRLDAYIENQVSLWDVAAGKLLVEQAGGEVKLVPIDGQSDKFSVVSSSGRLGF